MSPARETISYLSSSPLSSANTPLFTLMTSVDDYRTKINTFRTEYAKFADKEVDAKTEILKSKAALDSLNTAFSSINSIIADYGGNLFKSMDCGILSDEMRRMEYGLCVKLGPPYMVHTAITVWLGILLFILSCFYCTAIRWVAYETPGESKSAVYKIEISASGKEDAVYVDKEAGVKDNGDKIYKSDYLNKDEEVKAIKPVIGSEPEEIILQPMD